MSFLSDAVSRYSSKLVTHSSILPLTVFALIACVTPVKAEGEGNDSPVAIGQGSLESTDGIQSNPTARSPHRNAAAASFAHYAPDYTVKSALMAVPPHEKAFGVNYRLPAGDSASLTTAFATEETSGGSRGGSATAKYGEITGPITGFKAAWQSGDWDLYLTGYAYHLPEYYTEERLDELNAYEWGAGFGRSIDDAKGNRHLIYFMATTDSHYEPQFFAGYSWQHPFFPDSPIQVDLGISAFLFSRQDVAGGFPLPGILPYLAFGTKKIQILVTYVPPIGDEIGGQTIFFYARIGL